MATIDFGSLLSTEQKRSLLEQRIQQFAAEGWQHQLNRNAAESLGDTDLVAASDDAIAKISSAIEVHQAELATLPAPAPAE